MSLTIDNLNVAMVIRFTNPGIRNPLTTDVVLQLLGLVADVKQNRDIKKLVFTGSADVFAAGANLREIAQLDPESARGFAIRGQQLMNEIASLAVTTIAAVNGYCFGGALDLALACDQRIASPNATFAHPGVGLGIITGWGGTQRLPRLIGEARALEMLLTAGKFDCEWALRSGLIDEVSSQPFERAIEL